MGTQQKLTDEFAEKSWTKRGVNKLLKSCGTQAQLTGGQAATDRAVPTLKKTLRVETVNDSVFSQENKPQTQRTVREISQETGIHRCTQNAICLHFLPYLLNICRKFECIISQGIVTTCLR